ncbi:hypothetical protein EUX98_g6981 [Antrodiella citrinella]|uniref:Uncharacterized protein n=1 Tax=Antrodiella citrinella TaxID=2447956 RepID=A0A4S4MNG9_9APHY|nr:hypothetical protein EUX98_g6981 [Antrodiella citrinella]
MPSPVPEPPTQGPGQVKRKLNMAFVPLLPPAEDVAPPPSQPEVLTQQTTQPPDPIELESALLGDEAAASLSSLDLLQSESEAETDNESSPHTSSTSHYHRRRLVPMYTGSPSSSTTPSLSSASDTDDMDTEDEPPSVVDGSSAPSSPMEREGSVATLDHDREYNDNPYFPSLLSLQTPRQHPMLADMCEIARPGQTPPLSSLYPLASQQGLGLDMDMDQKMRLEAIPSPSLVPPSPFSLYTPSPEVSVVTRGRPFFSRNASKLSLAASVNVGEDEDCVVMGQRRGLGLEPSLTRRKEEEGEVVKFES